MNYGLKMGLKSELNGDEQEQDEKRGQDMLTAHLIANRMH
jgi:hypothetical protein